MKFAETATLPPAEADPLTSSAALIRALKTNGLDVDAKVTLAAAAWRKADLYIPGKREVLLEWLLAEMTSSGRVAKGKGKEKEQANGSRPPALLSLPHWTLFNQLLPISSAAAVASSSLASNALPPNLFQLLASFFQQITSPSISPKQAVALIGEVSKALDLAVPLLRVGAEPLIDLLDEALACWNHRIQQPAALVEELPAWETLLGLLASALDSVLPNNLARKKIAQAHVKSPSFSHLIRFIGFLPLESTLRQELLKLEASLVFPLEILQNLATHSAPTAPTARKYKQQAGVISTQQPPKIVLTSLDTPTGQDTRPTLYNALASLLAAPSTIHATLSHLPELLSLYSSLLATHRFILFPPPAGFSSPAEVYASEQISGATLRFLRELASLVGEDGGAERCECTKGLWSVVEQRGRVGRGYEEGQGPWADYGRETLTKAVGRLDIVDGAERDAIIQTLTLLLQLDYSLFEDDLPQLLVTLSSIPVPHTSSDAFLLSLVDFHAQTRTLPALVALLSDAITSASDITPYPQLAAGPLLDVSFLEALGKSFSTSLSVQSQLTRGLSILRIALKSTFNLLISFPNMAASPAVKDATAGEHKKKKRKVASDFLNSAPIGQGQPSLSPVHATVLALLSRLTSVYAGSAATLLTGNLPSALLAEFEAEYKALFEDVARPLVDCGLEGDAGERERDLVLGAGLRIWSGLKEALGVQIEAAWVERLGARLSGGKLGGEATVEVTRALLRSLLVPSLPSFSHSHLVDQLLTVLAPAKDEAIWTGRISDLDASGGRPGPSVAVATWALLTSGSAVWLGLLDRVASKAQLGALAALIINSFNASDAPETVATTQAVTMHSLTASLLALASFYELPQLRTALLGSIEASTSSSLIDTAPTALAARPYKLLLVLPGEYIPRGQRRELFRRALRLEKTIKLSATGKRRGSGEQERSVLRHLAMLVGRESFGSGSFSVEEDILYYLMMQSPFDELHSSPALRPVLTQSTTAILETAFRSIIKAPCKDLFNRVVAKAFHDDVHGPFEDAMASLVETEDNAQMDGDDDLDVFELDFPIRSCLLLLQVIKDETKDSSALPSELHLGPLVSALHLALARGLSQLLTVFAAGSVGARLLEHVDLVTACAVTASILHWLPKDESLPKTPSLSEGLARAYLQVAFSSTIASEDALSDFASAVTHLAAVDVQVVAEDASKRAAAVDTFLGIWLASATSLLSRRLSLEPVHSSLLGFTKNLLAAERTRVLQTLAGELSATDETTTPRIAEAAASAVHVILKDGAEVSNRLVVSSLLEAFSQLVESLPSWSILATIASTVEVICSDKAAHLQPHDAYLIWSILARALAPRSASDPIASTTASHPEIYISLVAAATSLVRHRRDLVASTAPHLTAVLIRLLLCLRLPRANLGGRQTRALTTALPGWWSPRHALPLSCARALARLLTSLTVKTVPRLHHSSDASAKKKANSKAESLATPLAKHAPYVLLAYVRLLTELDGVITSLVRHELEPGIGALCSMIGERDRDALMVSAGLDGGGKGVFKMVWAEWEKARYVGKG